MGTMADYLIRKLKDERNGMENAIAYLRAAFLSSAVDALFHARREAGLTQQQVAQKLGKKQEAIARCEADTEGKMSLRQYFDLAVASDRIPLNIVLEPVKSVHDFVIDHPEAPQTPNLYYTWLQNRYEPAIIAQPIPVNLTIQEVVIPSTNVSGSKLESTTTVKSVERYLEKGREQYSNLASYYSPPQGYGGNTMSTTLTTSHQSTVKAQSLA